MVNDPSSVPPTGPKHGTTPPQDETKTKPKQGEFHFKGSHKYLHMTFTAKEWNQLMNALAKNMTDYINKTFQKMTEKMKKDWKRGQGEDVDSWP